MPNNKVERIISEINDLSVEDLVEFEFKDCFNIMREMGAAMQDFIDKVDRGQIRSTNTYNKFKSVLEDVPAYKVEVSP